MKRQILWLPLILTAMLASAAVSTHAQSANGVRADVPFDFIVGDKTIPAGKIVAHGVTAGLAGALSIQNFDQGGLALRTGRRLTAAGEADQCKLVFNKYGNRYYLSQIWISGYTPWEVMKSKEERSLEREMRVVKNFKPALVALAAKLE